MVSRLPCTERCLLALSCGLGAWGGGRRYSGRPSPRPRTALGLGFRLHIFKSLGCIFLRFWVGRGVLSRCWWHARREPRVPSLCPGCSIARSRVATRRSRKLLSNVRPGISSHTRRPRKSTGSRSSPAGIILGPLLGVRENVVGRLDDEELRVDFLFPSRVPVRVIFQSCQKLASVDTSRYKKTVPSFRYCFLISVTSAVGDSSRSA